MCVSVNPELVRAINHQAFKLKPPNKFGQRVQTTWLRSLLFWGAIDLDLQGQIKLEKPNLSHFELAHAITYRLFKLEPPNLDKDANQLAYGPYFFGVAIDRDLHGQF